MNIAMTTATNFNLLVEQAQFDPTGHYLAIAPQNDVPVLA